MARKPQAEYESVANKPASGRVAGSLTAPDKSLPVAEKPHDGRPLEGTTEVLVKGAEPMTVYRVVVVQDGVVKGTSKRLLAGPDGVLAISLD
jgi:hypothetical protein